jgi:hypothetical protein
MINVPELLKFAAELTVAEGVAEQTGGERVTDPAGSALLLLNSKGLVVLLFISILVAP